MFNWVIIGKKHHFKFRSIFNMSMADFMNPFYGFDVIKFDAKLNVPDGVSTYDFIVKKYGEDAKDLILTLMGGGSILVTKKRSKLKVIRNKLPI
jgi:hypothetical protein